MEASTDRARFGARCEMGKWKEEGGGWRRREGGGGGEMLVGVDGATTGTDWLRVMMSLGSGNGGVSYGVSYEGEGELGVSAIV